MVHLADSDADGEYKMGLVHITTGRVESKQLNGEGAGSSRSELTSSVEVAWFRRSGKGRVWGKSPTFEWHPKLKEWQKKSKREEDRRRVTEWLPLASLLVRVADSDLTDKSKTAEVWLVRPRLKEKFMQKVHQLAAARSLVVPEEGGTGAWKQAAARVLKGRKAVAAEVDEEEEDEEDEEDEEEGGGGAGAGAGGTRSLLSGLLRTGGGGGGPRQGFISGSTLKPGIRLRKGGGPPNQGFICGSKGIVE